jgi:hypothetical protein
MNKYFGEKFDSIDLQVKCQKMQFTLLEDIHSRGNMPWEHL